uniref:Uncharacterized protein n=1 Tax=Kalanchoe fedtschenkoi TaxID=63787 RepID=A0A7N0U3K2_KALFE
MGLFRLSTATETNMREGPERGLQTGIPCGRSRKQGILFPMRFRNQPWQATHAAETDRKGASTITWRATHAAETDRKGSSHGVLRRLRCCFMGRIQPSTSDVPFLAAPPPTG